MDYTGDRDLPEVTDQQLQEALRTTRPYTVVVLRAGPAFEPPGDGRSSGVTATVWAHGKRNYGLYLAGLMPIVCPIADGTDTVGVSVFDVSPEDVERIMAGDPGVRAGLFTYEVHPTRSFPGSALPGA
jgi:hypothetical protein